VDEVPQSFKSPFQEDSGRFDRVVLVYPSLRIKFQDRRNIIHFADLLKDISWQPGAVVGGGFLFMAEVLRLVRDQAMELVALVCLLVAAALIPVLWKTPPWRIPLTLLTTVGVAFSSQAIMLALGVRVNLLNFAAIPITIGVGVDYVVNLFGAADALKVDLRGACVRMGGAIFLCSLTTVIGYFSLVLAQSGALRTFGWSAILGEVLAVSTVLLIYPTVGTWISRKGASTGIDPPGVLVAPAIEDGQELSK
jgi:predicted RND superfamily exporter protein